MAPAIFLHSTEAALSNATAFLPESQFVTGFILYMTLNLCLPMAVLNDAELYSKYSIHARLPRIVRLVEAAQPDVIGFQGARDAPRYGHYIVPMLSEALVTLGYNLAVAPRNNPGLDTAINIMAYREARLSTEFSATHWFFSRTPSVPNVSWGRGYEGVTQGITMRAPDVAHGKNPTVVMCYEDHAPRFHVINSHRDLSHGVDTDAAHIDYLKILVMSSVHGGVAILAGDFNTFNTTADHRPSDTGDRELQVYEDEGFLDVLQLRNQDGIALSGTVSPFPYDKFTPLDHIFVKVFPDASIHALHVYSWVDTRTFIEDCDIDERARGFRSELELEALIAEYMTQTGHKPFISDHFACFAKVVVVTKTI